MSDVIKASGEAATCRKRPPRRMKRSAAAVVGLHQVAVETGDGRQLEGVGRVVEKALRPLLEGGTGVDSRADLAAGSSARPR